MDREIDLVLFGATGYTGKLTLDYLTRAKPPISIAIAGRDRRKLEALGTSFPIVVCDAMNAKDVDALTRRARVVCTTVGPYALYGQNLVRACANNGTDYCDLSGEPQFIKESIDRNHEVAKRTGARIVHACGFDSIPSDLGVLCTYRKAQERGRSLGSVRARLVRMKGGLSGGTAASMLTVLEQARDPKVLRTILSPDSFDVEKNARRTRDRDRRLPRFDRSSGHWLGPFVMAAVNARIVRRSNGLLRYGDRFHYEEMTDHGSGARGFVHAAKMSGLLAGIFALAAIPGAPKLARRFVPQPGEGPTELQRKQGSFAFEFDAQTDASERIRTIVAGEQDPGYAETSKMLAESAMCLAMDDITKEGGVLTPASCMGDALLARLRAANMTFSSEWIA
jgi:short subunit dehydrogenase-like uncharacterized protein